MPRIEAESIQAHVRIQTGRIIDAAARLFNERGYRATDLSDIAREVGLARNSLYRYYSSKDHILLACLERDMGPSLARIRELETAIADPRERIDAWLELQMEIAATTCEGSMQMVEEVSASSPELRRQIAALHEPPASVLRAAMKQALAGSDRDPELLSAMITSMVRSAASYAMRSGQRPQALEQLKAAVGRVLA
jgi:AcrR family transcriptional regulator